MNPFLNKEPTFLKSVDLMVDRAIKTLDLPEGLGARIKVCNSVCQVQFPVKINGLHKMCFGCQ